MDNTENNVQTNETRKKLTFGERLTAWLTVIMICVTAVSSVATLIMTKVTSDAFQVDNRPYLAID